ncbi:MAG TPA: hypothetical protein VLK22_01570 [Candidatus Udaeobacter sp.]|nr:hypothetical protein [Candidatus Udaeobacter sp.]
MANTNFYKNKIEPYVRGWLADKFQKEFEIGEVELKLKPGGLHRFDAVSKDREIVAGIRSSVARKNTWQEGGKIKATYTEILFLTQIKAKKRLLVFTDKLFFEKFKKRSEMRFPKSIELIYCPLSNRLGNEALVFHAKASAEIGKK